MNSLIENPSQELDTHNALIIAPETEQSYESYSDEHEDTQAKGGLYKVEQKVIKKKKHNVSLEIPQNLSMKVISTMSLVIFALAIPHLAEMMGVTTEEVIEDTGSVMGMSQAKTAIHGFYNIISTIIPIILYLAAGVSLFALIKSMIKIEDAGEEEKVKEEVSEFKVPYPEEFYKPQITEEKASKQTEEIKTKSSMLFVPFPSELE